MRPAIIVTSGVKAQLYEPIRQQLARAGELPDIIALHLLVAEALYEHAFALYSAFFRLTNAAEEIADTYEKRTSEVFLSVYLHQCADIEAIFVTEADLLQLESHSSTSGLGALLGPDTKLLENLRHYYVVRPNAVGPGEWPDDIWNA